MRERERISLMEHSIKSSQWVRVHDGLMFIYRECEEERETDREKMLQLTTQSHNNKLQSDYILSREYSKFYISHSDELVLK